MHDQGICDPATQDDGQDWSVLTTLLSEGDQRPWSVDELTRVSGGDNVAVADAISRLQRSGLIHHTTDDLVFPTRAALYFEQIAG